jgi:hypothetical protein
MTTNKTLSNFQEIMYGTEKMNYSSNPEYGNGFNCLEVVSNLRLNFISYFGT